MEETLGVFFDTDSQKAQLFSDLAEAMTGMPERTMVRQLVHFQPEEFSGSNYDKKKLDTRRINRGVQSVL